MSNVLAIEEFNEGIGSVEEILHSLKLFKGIDGFEEVHSDLCAMFELRAFSLDERLINEGDTGDSLFVLCRGKVRILKTTVTGDEYRVVDLDGAEHAYFGEMALLTADKRSASIMALEEVDCLVATREKFDAFSKKNPLFAIEVVKRIAVRMAEHLKRANEDNATLYQALIEEVSSGKHS